MEREERTWLLALVGIALVFNAITLSPLVPWQEWLLWKVPEAGRSVPIEIRDYQFSLPPGGIQVGAGGLIEFAAVSRDVTYGLGVFRPDGTLVFQMQVLPGRMNRMLWRFDTPGSYDIRSTEYSGPRHSEMFMPGAVQVLP